MPNPDKELTVSHDTQVKQEDRHRAEVIVRNYFNCEPHTREPLVKEIESALAAVRCTVSTTHAQAIAKDVIEALINFEFNDGDGLRGFNPVGLEYAENILTEVITKRLEASANQKGEVNGR